MSDQTTCLSPYQFAYDDPALFNDPSGMFVHYQAPPSSTVTNTNPGFGGPSIEEINSNTGYDSDQGADAGENPNDNVDNADSGSGYSVSADGQGGVDVDFKGTYAQNFLTGLLSRIDDADEGEDFSYSYFQNQNGQWGYNGFVTEPGAPENGATLAEIKGHSGFIPFGGEDGASGSSESNGWENASNINDDAGVLLVE